MRLGRTLALCAFVFGLWGAGKAQTTQKFVYVFPEFSGDSRAQIILTNLSANPTAADLLFYGADGSPSTVHIDLHPNQQVRANPDQLRSLGAEDFTGTVIVQSASPLSAVVTFPEVNGSFTTLGPSSGSNDLLIPFSHGTSGDSEISIFNDGGGTSTVHVLAVAADGSTIGTATVTIIRNGTFRGSLSALIPAKPGTAARDVSHIIVRAPSSIFSGDRRVFALATVSGFLLPTEGVRVRRTDPAVVQAVPRQSAASSALIPFFIQDGSFFTIVQLINPSDRPGSVVLSARAEQSFFAGNNPATIQIPAGGSIRVNAQNIFSFASTSVTGSISAVGVTPIIATAAIGDDLGSFGIIPSAPAPATNFAFVLRDVTNRDFFTGFNLLNLTQGSANLTLSFQLPDGSTLSRATLRLLPLSSVTRTLAEFLPEARGEGVIHIASDAQIVATALEGKSDGTSLSPVPPMHSQPDFQSAPIFRFLATGTVRQNGAALPGVGAQLSGPVNQSVVTDSAGTFVFSDIPPGSYTIRTQAVGYAFTPSQINLTIGTENSRQNDFSAFLLTPVIETITPAGVAVGSPDTNVSVTGGPFNASSIIMLEGNPLPTTFALVSAGTAGTTTTTTAGTSGSGTGTGGSGSTGTATAPPVPTLIAKVSAQNLLVSRAASLTVKNVGPAGSVSSAPRPFLIGSAAPVLTGVSGVPVPLIAGNSGFLLTVTGTGFLEGAAVQVQGVERQSTRESSTTLRVQIPADDLAAGRNLQITAINPAPTVGPSNIVTLPVLNPVPGITSISPNSAEVRLEPNAPPWPLTVSGFGFRPDAKILINGNEVPTQFVNSTRLFGNVPATLLQVGGVAQVTVKNSNPTVASSEALPLFLSNLPPTLLAIDAGPLVFDSARADELYETAVVLHGANFSPASIVGLLSPCAGADFAANSATLVSTQELIAPVTIACAGTYQMRVRTPQPGGGLSAVLSFNVSTTSQVTPPSITGLSPSSVAAGSSTFTLTISGSGFTSGAMVNFGTAVVFPLSIAGNSIQVSIPSFLIQSSGIVPISVTNPNSTGSSNRVLFSVN